MKIDKNFGHRPRVAFVHRVTLARPIAGAAEALQLLNDDSAVFVLPFEHALEKFFAAKIVATDAFVFLQPTFDRGLRADSGVIHPRQPKHFEALHPRASGENVLDAVIQNVAEGEHAGDVGRRHDDRERLLLRIRVRPEVVIVDPTLIPFRLNRLRIVGLRKLSHREESSEARARLQTQATLLLSDPPLPW